MKLLNLIHRFKNNVILLSVKNTNNINPRVSKTSNNKTMLLSKRAIYVGKKPRLIKQQKAKEILSSLRLKAPLNEIPLLGDNLF